MVYGGHGAFSNSVISSVLFCVIPIFCSAAKKHTHLLEISYLGATAGSSSPPYFSQSADFTELMMETTFINRSLFAYF